MAELLDLAGIFVFAISGALVAVRKRIDVVGMAVLAGVTGIGGGILRDLMIAVPPEAFVNLGYFLVPLAATVLVFFLHPHVERVMPAVLVFDAAGLGLFAATGTVKALAYDLSPLHAVILGVCTATGGGVLRDVLARLRPVALYDRQLYVIPALVTAAATALGHALSLQGPTLTFGAALLGFLLRIAAMRYGWRARRSPAASIPRDSVA